MIKYHFKIDGISVYGDPYMEEDKILRGRKGKQHTFIVANPKIISALRQVERVKKLKRILCMK